MKLKKRHFIIGVILVSAPLLFIRSSVEKGKLTSRTTVSQPQPANPYLIDFLSSYDSIVSRTIHKTPGAAIVIVRGDSIVFAKGYGVKSVNTKDSVDINTVFRIGSVSKGFASLLSGILVEDSLLSFNDRVKVHLPQFSLRSQQHTDSLKIRHILSQSTGLPYQAYTTLIEDGIDRDVMIDELKNLEAIGEPGQYYSYQNVGYSLIEPILEQVSGKSYKDLLAERIFQPLGMTNSSSNYESILISQDRAMPHIRWKSGWHQSELSPNYYNTQAAGGVNASIIDMGKYLKALLGHRPDVIGSYTLDKLYSPNIRTYVRYKYFAKWPKVKKAYYGLGWRIVENGDDKVIYHGGYVNGFSSKIALIPEEEIGICILTNSSNPFIGKAIPDFLSLYDSYRKNIKKWNLNTPEILQTNKKTSLDSIKEGSVSW